MTYRVLLRIASILCFIHAAMHQLGMQQQPKDQAEIALTESMRSFQMNIMGATRSYMDFYLGMGLFLTATLLGFGVLIWIHSSAHGQARTSLRPSLAATAATFVAFAIISARFFFAAPIIMELAIALLVLFAWHESRSVA